MQGSKNLSKVMLHVEMQHLSHKHALYVLLHGSGQAKARGRVLSGGLSGLCLSAHLCGHVTTCTLGVRHHSHTYMRSPTGRNHTNVRARIRNVGGSSGSFCVWFLLTMAAVTVLSEQVPPSDRDTRDH